ncbi:plasmid pRiA4b ORF-3 family protein [Arthrobacter sp. NicSoilB8]|uniref:plasmid pRiA4b ORF-3 family protein n=1 Tax=Arthrobacter sp. NicSoilB8 TaxID=2830998 RepID=UPI001CC42E4D|nr:hypothetical protein NicSoilB8_45840 [Arthrobacter sp. NicSoilB8]
MGSTDKLEAGKLIRRETILEVRVELVHSKPSIWRQLEIRGSLALNQVHQVLQAAFDWEDAHLQVHTRRSLLTAAAHWRRDFRGPAVAPRAGM